VRTHPKTKQWQVDQIVSTKMVIRATTWKPNVFNVTSTQAW
jgi:hypothetical protein